MKLSQLKSNPNNPRLIKDDKFKLPSFPVRAVDDVLNTGGTEEPELTPEEEAMMKKIK